MKTLATVNGVIFAIVFGLVVASGFDLKEMVQLVIWCLWFLNLFFSRNSRDREYQ